VDYNEDSSNDEGAPQNDGIITLESPTGLIADQKKPSDTVKGEAEPEAITNVGAGTIAKRNAVLTQAIVLDLAATKQIKLHTSILDQTQQQAGLEHIYNYEELDGYTSPGGMIRMNKSLATVVFIAVAAATPNNKLLLKARQEAYELVMKQAKDLLEKQRKSFEDQCARMAEEHQNCMERMKMENEKMLEEATKVRKEYAQAFLLEETPSIRRIEESQSHLYYDNLSEQMEFKTQRLKDDYELEKKKRVRKEEDLKDAEDQILKLQQDLKKLEDLLERTAKRSLAIRNKDDSPEMHASKKTKVEEIPANTMAIIKHKVEVKREKPDADIPIRQQEPRLRLDSQGDITSEEPADRRSARSVQEVPSKIVKPLKSPSPERKYVGLDKVAQDKFHDRVCDYKGDNRRVSPTPDHYKNYSSIYEGRASVGRIIGNHGIRSLEESPSKHA
jgi:hypothetical protein